ncbi:MAG: hypothetical protein ABGY42_04015, partial [bacterium]
MWIRLKKMALASTALFALIGAEDSATAGAPERATLHMTGLGAGQSELRVNGETVATLTRIAAGGATLAAEALVFTAGKTTMVLRRSESEIVEGQGWPRR